MATVTFPTSSGSDMLLNTFPHLEDAYKDTATATSYLLYYSPTWYEKFTGAGFKYDAYGYPYAGTIASWSLYSDGKPYFSVTGLSMPVATYMSYYQADDWEGLLIEALSKSDKITGSAGDDDLYGIDGNDTISAGNGYDLVFGGDGNDKLLGQAFYDDLYGEAGDDTLDGGVGDDYLIGGIGNDTYILDNVGDLVFEYLDEGTDTILSSVTVQSFANVENVTLTGTAAIGASGNALDNILTGNSGSNTIEGREGSDTLRGGSGNDVLIGGDASDLLDGGLGADKMFGGAGNDVYLVNAATDVIDEGNNFDADDEVRSTVSVNLTTLAAGSIEHAMLIGTAAINATGNGAKNVLIGNAGANVLDGRGGADFMAGGKGADTYLVDDLGDLVFEEFAGTVGGVDLVKSTVDFSLSALINVEKLTLIGTDHIDATGNALANLLTGNDGSNRLDGLSGRDTLVGGRGDDTYVVDNAGDVVTESIANSTGGGFDTVESSVGFTLATRVNVDSLILTGSGNIAGTGNALANYLEGNVGHNRLDGGAGNDIVVGGAGHDTLLGGLGSDILFGGNGADSLTGGAGRDLFYYESIADAGDTITDFKLGATGDVLHLGDLLAELGSPADAFGEGFLSFTKAGNNTVVSIDVDGSAGAGAAMTLVTLANVTLTAADFANYDLAQSA